jgi:predicted nucleic acid-binding protein
VGIAVEWEFSERIWRSAGEGFQKYAERRRKQKGAEPRRILADFLIGAHALVSGYKLLTLDERTYRTAFPRLAIINV